MTSFDAIHDTARAKINLYLHVTGKRPDGYHLLESMIGFAEIGDGIAIEESDQFALTLEGPFAHALKGTNIKDNLIYKAAHGFAELLNMPPHMHITLTKNLPVAAGLGGGSADAAAVLRALVQYWKLDNPPDLSSLLTALGADVPVCYHQKSGVVSGIGDVMEKPITLPALPILLINPNIPCLTTNIFKALKPPYSGGMALSPATFETVSSLSQYLKTTRNDLRAPAEAFDPDITGMIEELEAQPLCHFAQMTGSGATCFGLFESTQDTQNAAKALQESHPTWWVQPSVIG